MLRAGAAAFAATALPVPGRAEESLDVAAGKGRLYGSLRLPAAGGPWPVVVIVAGSGPTDRDGNSPGLKSDCYRLLAEALAARNVASLRYDKRGVGASAGALSSEAELRFEDYAADVTAWTMRLASDKRFTKVGVAGHSEGSLLGILAAQRRDAGIRAFASLCGPGRRAGMLLLDQLKGGLDAALYARAQSIVAALERGRTVEDVPAALGGALFRPSVQPYLISWFKYDPAAELAKVRVPCVVVGGTADVEVPAAEARILAAGNPAAQLRIVDLMTHPLKHVNEDDPQSQRRAHTDPTLPVEPAVPVAIAGLF